MADKLFSYLFEKDYLSSELFEKKTLLVNLSRDLFFDSFKKVTVYQNFKPQAAAWQAASDEVVNCFPEKDGFDVVFIVTPKSKELSQFYIAKALEFLNEDGLIVAIGANDENGKRLKKWFDAFGLSVEDVSKSKHRIVWAKKNNFDEGHQKKIIKDFGFQNISLREQNYKTKPGIFGWNKVDRGSKLLVDYLPDGFKGKGADFGCGYGFLADYLLKNNSEITGFSCLDADYDALQCAKENLKGINVDFQWHDLNKKPNLSGLDFIVMNPPFHEGKKQENKLGQNFIINASSCLKKNGTLYMVANAFLPYEKILEQSFSDVKKLTEQDGFKVFKAVK